jgi:hypothetical protein
MKKTNILLIISIILVLSIIAFISSSGQNINQNINKCVNSCLREDAGLTKDCNTNYNNQSKSCREIYNSCIKIATKAKTSKENCSKYYSACKISISIEKVECKNNILKNCNNRCTINTSKNCTINPFANMPVCGINNITYLNECFLEKYNIQKNYDGFCIRN